MEPQLPDGLSYREHPGGLTFIDIDHPNCRASLCLQGAQMTRYCGPDGVELLWLSQAEAFVPGTALRGGIPICWPWFGAHPTDASAPAHGIARTATWALISVSKTVAGVSLTLQLPLQNNRHVPAGIQLSLQIELGAYLRLRLTTQNLGAAHFSFSQALHSYFAVGDIALTQIAGLAGAQFDDLLRPAPERSQLALHDSLAIDREIDRIYYPKGPLQLLSPAQSVSVAAEGSGSAVIWNPWIDKSARLSHFKPDDYRRTLCLETANCGRDSRTLAPGASHTLCATYTSLAAGKF